MELAIVDGESIRLNGVCVIRDAGKVLKTTKLVGNLDESAGVITQQIVIRQVFSVILLW